jgi:hypothetical protein
MGSVCPNQPRDICVLYYFLAIVDTTNKLNVDAVLRLCKGAQLRAELDLRA